MELKAEIGFWVECNMLFCILDCNIMLPLSVSDVHSEKCKYKARAYLSNDWNAPACSTSKALVKSAMKFESDTGKRRLKTIGRMAVDVSGSTEEPSDVTNRESLSVSVAICDAHSEVC